MPKTRPRSLKTKLKQSSIKSRKGPRKIKAKTPDWFLESAEALKLLERVYKLECKLAGKNFYTSTAPQSKHTYKEARMARSQDIVDSVADLNLKSYTDRAISLMQREDGDSIDHRRRTQVLAENNIILAQAITTRAAKGIVELDTEQGSAIKQVVGAGVPDSISALQAAVATMAMTNKSIDLSPPNK